MTEQVPEVPEVVTFHVWRVDRRHLATAVARVALDRFPLRRTPGLRFAKVLGTGDARLAPLRGEPRRWAVLAAWARAGDAAAFERSAVVRRWDAMAEERCGVHLRPLLSRGRWARRRPFGDPRPATAWDGPVASVTRARLAPTRAVQFWRSVPPVTRDLHRCDGLRLALGFGEAPVGLQGTFSVWESAGALRDFVHGSAAHRSVVRRTPAVGWYAEELFARFAVLSAAGTVDGAAVLR